MHPSPSSSPSPAPESAGLRPFFLRLVLFLPFAFVVYVIGVCALGSLSNPAQANPSSNLALFLKKLPRNLDYQLGLYGHMLTRTREARQTRDIDILFLGSSHCYRGFDTRLFAQAGFKTFNLGSSQQSHLQTRVLLQRYLRQLNPKIVIYDVFPGVFPIDGVESALDLIANDRNDRHSLRMALAINHLKVYHSLLFGFFRDFFHLNDRVREPRRRGPDTYIPGGYLHNKISHFDPATLQMTPKHWRPRPDQLAAFEDNITLIRAHGARLILLQAPWPKCKYRLYLKRHKFDRQMQAYGEYYNFTELMNLDDRQHFYDQDHLNQLGVELFNRELLQRLFPDHPLPPSSQNIGY